MSEARARPPWLRRHHLLWTAPEWHAAAVEQVAVPGLCDRVAGVLAQGWPMVVRRQTWIDDEIPAFTASIAAGLPLPPALGRHRLAFVVPREAIVRTAPPPALAEVIPCLPPDRQPPLRQLFCAAAAIGVELRVFGSAAWQALTGYAWLTPASDIDLLWQARDATQIAAVIAMLEAWERECGLRADGEILFGHDDAVAWREWNLARRQFPVQRVIVKSLRSASLCAPNELLARLRHEHGSEATCA